MVGFIVLIVLLLENRSPLGVAALAPPACSNALLVPNDRVKDEIAEPVSFSPAKQPESVTGTPLLRYPWQEPNENVVGIVRLLKLGSCTLTVTALAKAGAATSKTNTKRRSIARKATPREREIGEAKKLICGNVSRLHPSNARVKEFLRGATFASETQVDFSPSMWSDAESRSLGTEHLSLEEQVARLHALLQASRQLHGTNSADQVLFQTARVLVRELEVKGALFLSPAGEPIVSYGTQVQALDQRCTRFELRGKNNDVLAQLVVATEDGCKLSLYEHDFIDDLVLQVAVALESAIMHERELLWVRVAQDLDAARDIQRSLLPKAIPQLPGLSVAVRSVTCYEVGGDYLDVLERSDGSLLFMVADVAGKGLASAVVAMSFRAAFRSLAAQPTPLAEVMERISQWHWDEGQEARRRYVTAILVRLDFVKGIIEVVNAGHNPGAFARPDGSITMIQASGVPLGMLPSTRYQIESFEFPPGSRLLLYTDGLTEVFCGEDEFGCERLTETFRSMSTKDAEETLENIWDTLHHFSLGAPQSDDMTALVVCHRCPSVIDSLVAHTL